MTVFFPDISSYEAGLTIQPGTVAVIAKATEGTYYRDAQYAELQGPGREGRGGFLGVPLPEGRERRRAGRVLPRHGRQRPGDARR